MIHLTTKEEQVLRAMRNHLGAAGIPVENSKGEWGLDNRNSMFAMPKRWKWPTAMSS